MRVAEMGQGKAGHAFKPFMSGLSGPIRPAGQASRPQVLDFLPIWVDGAGIRV